MFWDHFGMRRCIAIFLQTSECRFSYETPYGWPSNSQISIFRLGYGYKRNRLWIWYIRLFCHSWEPTSIAHTALLEASSWQIYSNVGTIAIGQYLVSLRFFRKWSTRLPFLLSGALLFANLQTQAFSLFPFPNYESLLLHFGKSSYAHIRARVGQSHNIDGCVWPKMHALESNFQCNTQYNNFEYLE